MSPVHFLSHESWWDDQAISWRFVCIFLRVVKLRLFLCFSWKPMFPFEKIKPFLVTNEDLKLVLSFGRKNCGPFKRKTQKRNEISLRRKKFERNAKKLPDRPTTIRALKNTQMTFVL